MTITFTFPQLREIAQHLGFKQISSYHIQEDELYIYGPENDDYAEASLYIDFCTKVIYVTVYYASRDYLDEEMKFKLNF